MLGNVAWPNDDSVALSDGSVVYGLTWILLIRMLLVSTVLKKRLYRCHLDNEIDTDTAFLYVLAGKFNFLLDDY